LNKIRILFFYEHFLPAWKAGGPIRSIAELVHALHSEYAFHVLTSAFDHNEKKPMDFILTDQWVEWEREAQVYYHGKHSTSISFFNKQIGRLAPNIIFINGLFSFKYNMIPLLAALRYKKSKRNIKIILSPRGMLHPGALSQKKIKKSLFLYLFRLSGLPNKLHWHATDEKEAHYIRSQFKKASISIAGNFPKLSNIITTPHKVSGKLIMGTLALISPMKNHLEILLALKELRDTIIWHIFGPVKDTGYWSECNKYIQDLPDNIQVIYHGAIPPDEISKNLELIQLFILPSKSENFGHAILEALSAGIPVITTNTTPFIDLQSKKAGYTISINNLKCLLIQTINDFADMDQETFSQYQKNAIHYANSFVNIEKLKNQYRDMFSITH
jgi:glycosyltransferase involved in cell wall biosynthesis